MKMDVSRMSMEQVEGLVARLERFGSGAILHRNGSRLELVV